MIKKNGQTVKRLNRRYHLHQLIKKWCRYDAKKHIIYVFDKDTELQANRYIVELRDKHQYSVQLEAIR